MIEVQSRTSCEDLIKEKDKEIERLNNRVRELEKAVSRKEEQITDLDDENFDLENEIERLNNIINESAEEILKELEENHHLSYGVALAIRQKLLDYKELKGVDEE